MQPEQISERASRIREETESILKIIEEFEAEFNRKVINALRESAMKDIEQIIQKTMNEAEKELEDKRRFATLHRADEVYIQAKKTETLGIIFEVFQNNRIAAEHLTPGWRKSGIFCVPAEVFKKIIQNLITSIREGKLDEKIHSPTKQIIYDAVYEATEPK